MKQYVDYYGKGTKKVPLPVVHHLRQAVGALTLHTGRNYMFSRRHKKCPQRILASLLACLKMVNGTNMVIIFENAKEKDYFCEK